MYIKSLLPKESLRAWKIYGICSEREECHVEDFLLNLPPNKRKAKFDSLFQVVTERGPFFLPKEQCHVVDENEKIYEFIKGDLRILFFTDSDKVVICSHGFIKQRQKTPPTQVARATRSKDAYFQAKSQKNLKAIDPIQEDD